MLQSVTNGAWMQLFTDEAMHSATIDGLYLCTMIIPMSSILAVFLSSEQRQYHLSTYVYHKPSSINIAKTIMTWQHEKYL